MADGFVCRAAASSNSDYVIPVNLSTKKTGNSAIEIIAGEDFFNEFYEDNYVLAYQIKYHVNYSIANANTRNIEIYTALLEDDLFGNDLVEPRNHNRRMSIVVNDISQHTSGVDYFIGPNGWYVRDSKTGQQFDGENMSNIGFFEYLWYPRDALGFAIASDAEFFTNISIHDGSLEERYNGDYHWNTKISYRQPGFQIMTPASGTKLSPGSTQEIQWKTYYWNNNHEISIGYGDPSVTWDSYSVISRVPYNAYDIQATGTYSWTVPNNPGDWRLALVRMNEVGWTYMAPVAYTNFTIQEPVVGTVTSAGQVWMDRNLGASRVATSSTDSEAYGDLYQWGRGTDGHEKRDSPITSTNSTSDTPGHGSFITEGNSPYDWRIPQNGNLWQGVSGVNNPCPAGFRLPTFTEWETERDSWSSHDAAGAYASPLKLVVAGYRNRVNGTILSADSHGSYWGSTVTGSLSLSRSCGLGFGSSADMGYNTRAVGFSVRCIKD